MTVRAVSSNPTSPFYNANAPTLTGQVGSLTAVLDAVLVNGFTGFTALGWSINQTTTNKRGYKQNLTGSNNTSGMLLYVDDTGPGAGAAREARACGFETMSAITPTGTGQFPTGAQSAVGSGQLVIRKSTTADATTRNWTIVGNGQTFYLFIESGDTVAPPLATTTFVFGDFRSYKASDQYAVCIIGRTSENTGSAQFDALHAISIGNNVNISPMNSTMYGHFAARSWTGTGGSLRLARPFDLSLAISVANVNLVPGPYASEAQTSSGSGVLAAAGRYSSVLGWPSPNGPDGSLALSPVYLGHNFALRGYLPGLFIPLHDRPLGHNDSFTVSGGTLNGKSLLAQNIQAYISSSANGENGQIIVETSDTWP